jgi:hypothetical protein
MMSERERRGDRATVLAPLAGTIVPAWAYLLRGGGLETHAMNAGGDGMMPMIRAWTPGYAMRVLTTWGGDDDDDDIAGGRFGSDRRRSPPRRGSASGVAECSCLM